ncbi:MAG: glutamate--cysteine ligase [Burkholderiaceae bacterium]|nr:glutamate--cysteine ligase [Burkholderiaceae bacterium]MCD8517801.1 glutamate--cysteine ligase [Burkholderiaceae bacterium]MCD8537239.1 glutamate--cysteine ligase [Burkholderiaceae bacterium]MCD8564655.1 glutamate--cysteine ligase [Burkholderiaceae bacterium]
MLTGCLRGIEKEGLRVDSQGWLSTRAHPQALGSALTHPHITTDYSEALLELITGTHHSASGVTDELEWVHRLAMVGLGDELLWNQSMPALLPAEPDIPIAWYGDSNTGMLKHVYRRGLAVRYGKLMQCIAGLHYNFSLPDALWTHKDLFATNQTSQAQKSDRQSEGYVALIRNFVRYSWLLMYLFGASPAVSNNFLRNQNNHGLLPLGLTTSYLPWATSLRMSDLGYQNKAQSTLKLCYNDLPTFLDRLYSAVTTPWPAYESIGTKRDGQWIQLNCNLLQIENEFYSTIRPKRATGRGERPITALAKRGVQYIEVRCLDIDPFEPTGISAQTVRFMDAFLLFCALEHSPQFGDDGYCTESAQNFNSVVIQGRKPGLALSRNGIPVDLPEWAYEVLDRVADCADLLATQLSDETYRQAVQTQRDKVKDVSLTPSARVLATLEQGQSFHEFALSLSKAHTEHFRKTGLSAQEQELADRMRDDSLAAQKALEADKAVSFEQYVEDFHRALQAPQRD